jgi:hypothetical protein
VPTASGGIRETAGSAGTLAPPPLSAASEVMKEEEGGIGAPASIEEMFTERWGEAATAAAEGELAQGSVQQPGTPLPAQHVPPAASFAHGAGSSLSGGGGGGGGGGATRGFASLAHAAGSGSATRLQRGHPPRWLMDDRAFPAEAPRALRETDAPPVVPIATPLVAGERTGPGPIELVSGGSVGILRTDPHLLLERSRTLERAVARIRAALPLRDAPVIAATGQKVAGEPARDGLFTPQPGARYARGGARGAPKRAFSTKPPHEPARETVGARNEAAAGGIA